MRDGEPQWPSVRLVGTRIGFALLGSGLLAVSIKQAGAWPCGTAWLRSERLAEQGEAEGGVGGGLALLQGGDSLTSAGSVSNPQLVVQTGHSREVLGLAFSPDGRFLASGGWDRTVRLWEVETGVLRAAWKGHGGPVVSVAFSEDGATIGSGSYDGTIRLWDVGTGATRAVLEGHSDWVCALAFSPDGRTLASASFDGTIRTWDAGTGEPGTVLRGFERAQLGIAFSPDGATVASGSGSLKLWNLRSGQLRTSVRGVGAWVWGIAYSPDGRRLATGDWDGRVRLWDPTAGTLAATLGDAEDGPVLAVAFAPDGGVVVSGSRDGTVRLWDAARVQVRGVIEAAHKGAVTSVAFHPDGEIVASGGSDGAIRMWDAASSVLRREFPGEAGAARSVAFSPDGRFVVAGTWDGAADLWDSAAERARGLGETRDGPVHSVAFSPDGGSVAIGRSDGVVEVRDVGTSVARGGFEGVDGAQVSVAYSADGRYLAAASRRIRIWEVDRGTLRAMPGGHDNWILDVAFSRDGRLVASAGDDGLVKLWSVETGEQVAQLDSDADRVQCIAFSPDGRRLAAGGRGVVVWAIEGRVVERRLGEEQSEWVADLAFSPDGETIASVGDGGSITLWSVREGSVRSTFESRGPAFGVAYRFDGSMLAVAAVDGLELLELARLGRVTLSSMPSSTGRAGIAYADDGRWCGDDRVLGSNRVMFRLGGSITEAEMLTTDELGDAYFQAGLVAEFFQGGSVASLAGVGANVGLPPEVQFVSVPLGEVDADTAFVCVRAIDRGGGVARVAVAGRGGAVVDPLPRGTRPEDAPRCDEVDEYLFEVPLEPGENELLAEAVNQLGGIRSRRVSTTVRSTAAVERVNLYVLAVSVRRYEDQHNALRYPTQDADDLVASLVDQAGGLYGGVFPHRLADAEVSVESIEAEAAAIQDAARGTDALILFLAGHAVILDGEYYFLTFKSSLDNDDTIRRWGLSRAKLVQVVRSIRVNKKIVVLDTCHAGAVPNDETMVAMRGASRERGVLRELARNEGVTVWASTTEEEEAAEIQQLGHGLLTSVLLDGLRGAADANTDGIVTLDEMNTHLNNEVPHLAEQYLGHPQYPRVYPFGTSYPLVRLPQRP